MKVLLWECGAKQSALVLWDGEKTYWQNGDRGTSGKVNPKLFGKVDKVTKGRFTLIGEL